jgi:hypothetical protein
MGKGIIGQVQLLATLVFAIPVGMFGADLLWKGQTTSGLVFVGIAILMVVVEEYVTRPTDVVTDKATQAASKVVKSPDEADSADDEVVDADEAAAELAEADDDGSETGA